MVAIWSGILVPRMKLHRTATSAYVESQFNILKNNVFHNFDKDMRVDEFLVIFMRHINARCIAFQDKGKTDNLLRLNNLRCIFFRFHIEN